MYSNNMLHSVPIIVATSRNEATSAVTITAEKSPRVSRWRPINKPAAWFIIVLHRGQWRMRGADSRRPWLLPTAAAYRPCVGRPGTYGLLWEVVWDEGSTGSLIWLHYESFAKLLTAAENHLLYLPWRTKPWETYSFQEISQIWVFYLYVERNRKHFND